MPNGSVLEVHCNQTNKYLKRLMTVKTKERILTDILIVPNLPAVFPKDMSGLPPAFQVENSHRPYTRRNPSS